MEEPKEELKTETIELTEAAEKEGEMLARIRNKLTLERQKIAQQNAALSLVMKKGSVGRARRSIDTEERQAARRERRAAHRRAERQLQPIRLRDRLKIRKKRAVQQRKRLRAAEREAKREARRESWLALEA